MADAPKEIRLAECENLIKQIRDVISVNIVLGDNKEIEEIHILAEDTRNAKQLVRDVETLLRVEYGLDLDHKKISVVQLKNEQKLLQDKRVKFTAIQYSLQGSQLEALVELTSDKRSCQGKSCGVNSSSNRLRLFAEATLNALNDFLDSGTTVFLEDVVQYPMGRRNMISAALTYMQGPSEEYLVGSALIKQDEKEAVVRATLDAINRRIPIDI
ncbi:hypothetical protein [Dethiobacter alkaliphilus]|uniref:Uncharacterized protein n=1 Tax=Dethiobacter alkaliphilus AHT 1 TaxID=555088 RepID=C0GF83_DETAL|nr:hypothetical protein [Dethiobacter alkaliphilus]EEG77843.1 conserved hypothetical protein [Dethiobacter alkaliphilus AHT 1]